MPKSRRGWRGGPPDLVPRRDQIGRAGVVVSFGASFWRARPEPPPMPPLQLNDEEKDMLLSLAQPIDQRLRSEFLAAVEAELSASGQGGGVGAVHRIGRVVQRRFWDPPQSTALGTPQRRGERA